MDNYILKERVPVKESNLMKWAKWFGESDRTVKCTEINGTRISTVFLGIDHRLIGRGAPILFETMIFGDDRFKDYQERYVSWDEALKGHEHAVLLVQNDVPPS